MAKTRKPNKINVRPGADRYAGPAERIAEFEGGLISLRYVTDDNGVEILHVSLYRLDANVAVSVEHDAAHTLVATPVTAAPELTGAFAVPVHAAQRQARLDLRPVRNTGDATATNGGVANTGVMRSFR